jgi:hypothetical protein
MIKLRKLPTGIKNPKRGCKFLFHDISAFIDKYVELGKNIFDENWDACIILDACRYDLFRSTARKHTVWHDFDTVERAWSLASTTQQWAPRTFNRTPEKILKNTAYVTSNANIECSSSVELGAIDHVWQYASKPNKKVDSSTVTNRAASYIQSDEFEQVVIHYALPHAPFPHCIGKYDSQPSEEPGSTQTVWKGLRDGRFGQEEIWKDYQLALKRGLGEVKRVINHVNGRILVTSDHGNLLGEWGFYGHPHSMLLPSVRRVPWATAEGDGKESLREMSRSDIKVKEETSREEHLKMLGYR